MSWEHFIYFAIAAVLLWAVGAWAAWKSKTGMAYATTVLGLLFFFSFILSMWISLERPPLRTMGETRLWYSFFLPLAGLIVYSRWKYKWILSFSTILALVFICVNLFKPEIHDKTLMPALQSPWFAPHVIVYMFAYAVLGAAAVMAIYLLFIKKSDIADQEFDITDNLVYVGLAFLKVLKYLFGFFGIACPCEVVHLDGELFETCCESLVMLISQDCGRYKYGSLFAVACCLACCSYGDFGLAESDVSTHQSVHGAWFFHVRFHFLRGA